MVNDHLSECFRHAELKPRKLVTRMADWFVFFAPRDNPKIAGVIFTEHGIHGPNAARLSHHVLDTFFAKAEGRPLPPPPVDLHLDLSDPYARTQAVPAVADEDDIDR